MCFWKWVVRGSPCCENREYRLPCAVKRTETAILFTDGQTPAVTEQVGKTSTIERCAKINTERPVMEATGQKGSLQKEMEGYYIHREESATLDN